jgi:hypothetical protein
MESGEWDVILSPELYWIKKVDLPVKKVSAAKKLAESIFDGSIPSGEYAYDVSKSGDEFILLAYDKEQVLNILKEKFIKNSKISSVYFAQNEFNDLEDCCGIDKDNSLINLNGLIMQVPRVCTESKQEISAFLKNKRLSKHKVSLGSFESSVIEKKEFYLVAACVTLLVASNVVDWVNYSSATSKLDAQRSEIISKYDLPPTSMQLKSIKSSLSKTFNTQKKMRDEIFALNSIGLQKGEFIQSINTGKKETVVLIRVNSEDRVGAIKSMISKKARVKSSSFENSYVTVRIES